MLPDKKGFRVIIVGGGVTGLTLANSLQHAGVDFLVLETRGTIAPQLGASIGLSPNGSRILDQLSCYDDLEEFAEPVKSVGYHDARGKELCPRSDRLRLVETRTNYPVVFLERRDVLQVLANHIREKERVLLNKKVARVDHFPTHVMVHCVDGTTYQGDVVVGADGISSKVRREMFRVADGEIPRTDKSAVRSEYKCLFGISSNIPALPPGDFNVTHKKDVSTLVINGKRGEVYWFLFVKMDRIYQHFELPRFTEADTEALAQRHLDLPIFKAVTFSDLWANKNRATLLAMEEADFETWTWGRFVCVGDSVHKMTPNSGAGGMAAIESAAALANAIHELLFENGVERSEKLIALEEIRRAFTRFHQGRKQRASAVVQASNNLTRLQAMRGFKEMLLVHLGIPFGDDFLIHAVVMNWIGAPLLNFLPPPPRSQTASMSFDPVPPEKTISPSSRFGLSILFLILSFSCLRILKIIDTRAPAPIPTPLLGLDFFTSGPLNRSKALTSIANYGIIYAVLLFESARRGNMLSLARLPLLFGVASIYGIGATMPVYYFFHYLLCPGSYFRAADWRLTDISYTISILPVMLAGYYVPYFLDQILPTYSVPYLKGFPRHLFPLWISLAQFMVARTIAPHNPQYDRPHRFIRDIYIIRITIGALIALTALIFLRFAEADIFPVLDPFAVVRNTVPRPIQELARLALQTDQFHLWLSSLFWICCLFFDLRGAGFIAPHWITVFTTLACVSLFFGTGVAVGVGWVWREEILVRRKLIQIVS